MIGRAVFALAAAVSVVACGGGERESRYPKRAEGCDVALYRDTPPGRTVNIGPVHAACDESVAEGDCVRTLKDAVCHLGGDVVWGVDGPTLKPDGKNHWEGRAAHTRR